LVRLWSPWKNAYVWLRKLIIYIFSRRTQELLCCARREIYILFILLKFIRKLSLLWINMAGNRNCAATEWKFRLLIFNKICKDFLLYVILFRYLYKLGLYYGSLCLKIWLPN
jgi:hypothetical protein